MITVIDYGMGNLHSVKNALNHLGRTCIISSNKEELKSADGLILPGVGAFPDAADRLRSAGLDELICALAKDGKPLLGICLGMQLLFEESCEFKYSKGLSLIEGGIVPINAPGLKIPHMGWNELFFERDDMLTKEIRNLQRVYFVHSYRAETKNENVICYTQYGEKIPALVKNPKLPVWGAQFHPEKSHDAGLTMLRNYCEIVEGGRL